MPLRSCLAVLPRAAQNKIFDHNASLVLTEAFGPMDIDCRVELQRRLRPLCLEAGEYAFKALEVGMEMFIVVR